MKIIYDTNVLLDHLLGRPAGLEASRMACLIAVCGYEQGYITSNCITDIFYFLTKEIGSAKAQSTIEVLLESFSILPVSSIEIKEALRRRWADMEDCLLSVCAENIGASVIITRNIKDFKQSCVRALSPKGFFDWSKTNNITYDIVDF